MIFHVSNRIQLIDQELRLKTVFFFFIPVTDLFKCNAKVRMIKKTSVKMSTLKNYILTA